MPVDISVSNVSIRFVRTQDPNFIGYASCVVDECLRLDNMKVMRARDGRLTVTFPGSERTPSHQRPPYYPTNADARRAFEDAILGELQKLTARTNGGQS
ncbi:MAG: septation protein SpoVG family protein [Coriobacteriia bacterium]|nr:septation protein SpoVG family protein [Coriobacteriia bacterium]